MLCAVVRLLLEDAAPKVGATAWRVAVQTGLLAVVRLLLEDGAPRVGATAWRVAGQSWFSPKVMTGAQSDKSIFPGAAQYARHTRS